MDKETADFIGQLQDVSLKHHRELDKLQTEVLILVTARRQQAELIRDLTAMVMRYNSMMLARDQQLRTLQGVVGSLQQDIATLEEENLTRKDVIRCIRQGITTLEEKFSLMEKVLNVEVIPHIQDMGLDDVDVEQEYQRQESLESRRNGYGADL